jgi:hypothetical protein
LSFAVSLEDSVVVEVDEALGEVPADAESDDVEDEERGHRIKKHFGALQNVQSPERLQADINLSTY